MFKRFMTSAITAGMSSLPVAPAKPLESDS